MNPLIPLSILACCVHASLACMKVPAISIPGGGGGGDCHGATGGCGKKCLHENGRVLMADGSHKRAGDLYIGDRVMNEDGQATPVVLLPNSDPHETQAFVTFTTKSGLGTTMTPDHAVFARECTGSNDGAWPIKRSGDLSLTDCVPIPTNNGGAIEEDSIESISLKEMTGRVHPITASGKLIVDGVLVSCYDYSGENSTQEINHTPFEPVRVLYSIGEKIYNGLTNEQYAIGMLESLIRGLGLEKVYE